MSVDDNPELSERELRKLKNKEWREKRERASCSNSERSDSICNDIPTKDLELTTEHKILNELLCPFCHEEMGPPMLIFQCKEGHNLCNNCKSRPDMKVNIYKT